MMPALGGELLLLNCLVTSEDNGCLCSDRIMVSQDWGFEDIIVFCSFYQGVPDCLMLTTLS